ncbi:hypothetical protein AHV57_22200 [Salmonella enterica]|nr:hypothetical protein [Salmonella enterica]
MYRPQNFLPATKTFASAPGLLPRDAVIYAPSERSTAGGKRLHEVDGRRGFHPSGGTGQPVPENLSTTPPAT